MRAEHADPAEQARLVRFGALPRRIRPEETVEEHPAPVARSENGYDSDEWLVRNCW